MTKPQFGRAVRKIGRSMLEPVGFSLRNESEPGKGAYSFLRAWKAGYMQGICVYPNLRLRAFTVELGVVRDSFLAANFVEKGAWRELGLRVRLGKLVLPEGLHVDPFRRDFVPYNDQPSLEDALRVSMEQALLYGPAVWERLGRRLLEPD